MNKLFTTTSMALFVILSLLSACVSIPTLKSAASCTIDASSQSCILETASILLADTQDNFDSTSAAAELAIAYDVASKPEQASSLITQAIKNSSNIEDLEKRGSALVEIITAISTLKPKNSANQWLHQIQALSADLPEATKANITAKTIIADAVHEDLTSALNAARALPQANDTQENYKAVTLRKIADLLAKDGDFYNSRSAIDAITMSIAYYQAMAQSDVARTAYKARRTDLTKALLEEAEVIARAQDDGYFIGAVLRDIAYDYQIMGDTEKASRYFKDALAACATAKSPNARARSTSRIATRLADAKLVGQSRAILDDAVAFSTDISSETTKGYTYYEIAGSAAFSGEFDIAKTLIELTPDAPLGAASSMKNAAKRDLAWGLARYGKLDEALSVTQSINSPRERIHALSRIVRLLYDPEMNALPRYL